MEAIIKIWKNTYVTARDFHSKDSDLKLKTEFMPHKDKKILQNLQGCLKCKATKSDIQQEKISNTNELNVRPLLDHRLK